MNDSSAFSRNDGERRLTVVVADDTPAMLDMASTLLAADFHVVAAVADGQQALNAALQLDPDLVVLDVSMPVLDGFQTCRALKRAGSRAKILMLTMHDADEYVVGAIEAGAQGYILKTRMQSDLAAAVDHATAGRIFVPSVTSLLDIGLAGRACGHALQFRANDQALVEESSRLVDRTLQRGGLAVVAATEATRSRIAQRLVADGHDVDDAASRGIYVSLDAADALAQVMVNGRLDLGRLQAIIDDLEHSRLAASASCVTVIGEMGPLLCLGGNTEAATDLERAWDELTRALPFFTLCSYPMICFGADGGPGLFRSICASHGSACHAHDE